MNTTQSKIQEGCEFDNTRIRSQSSGPVIPLILVAAAMELLYLWMLRLSNLKEHVETVILLVLLQGILYFVSVYFGDKISPRRAHLILIFLAAAVFRLTLFPLYPSLSDDPYRYRWEGKAQQAGLNPYSIKPSDPAMAFLKDETFPSVSGPGYSTIYGPFLEEVFWVSFVLLKKVVAMKLPFVLFDLGIVLVLFRLLPALGVSPTRAIIYAWSPLTVVEFAASGHNDSLAVLAFVLALWWYHKRQERLSIAALALAALTKIYALFLFPVFVLRTSWRFIWIPALFAAVVFAPYGGGWRDLIVGLSNYGKNWKNNESLYLVIRHLTASDSQAGKLYLAIIIATMLYCTARKLAPERAAYLILGTIILFSPNVFPWYLTWIVPLLAIYPNPGWMLLTITAFLSYHVLIPYRSLGLWQENHFFTVLEYVPFYGLLIGEYLAAKLRRHLKKGKFCD